jgi:hypothetical protein
MLTYECTITASKQGLSIITLRSPILPLPIVSVQLKIFTKASFFSSYLGDTKSAHEKKGHKNHMLCKFSSSLQ